LGGNGIANNSGFYLACCPAHNDRQASLSLKDRPGGLYLRCFAGCRTGEIRAAILTLMRSGAFVDKRAPEPGPAAKPKADLLAVAARIWHEAGPITGSLAEYYLRHHRGISIELPDVLRFHPSLFHRETGVRAPAMIAVLRDVHGESCAIHRTWLCAKSGGKAALDPVRKALCPTAGRAVRLREAEPGQPLLLTEGVETALSAMQLFGSPTWSALSAPGLAELVIPAGIEEVVIALDDDKAGRDAANKLADRLMQQNPRMRVSQRFPSSRMKDFNDMLLLRGAA